jgi:hypothetical protein
MKPKNKKVKMEKNEILKYGEIQYLKGRLDELHKAYPTVSDLNRKRKIDQRIEKYLNKLKIVDEVSYHLYLVELKSRYKAKERSKRDIKDLLEQILINENIVNEDILERIKKQIDTY